MTALFNRNLLLITTLVFPLANASGQLQLTDITIFSADAAGNFTGPDAWDTRPANSFDVWIQGGASGGPFLNGPTDAAAQPNISLSLGTNSFRLFGEPGADFSRFGINLFFNGAITPSISAYGLMLTAQVPHTFAANGAPVTIGTPSIQHLPGAGSLSFVSGGELITLTDFYWSTPSVYSLDLVGTTSTGTSGLMDYVGGITLSVTEVPEPQLSLWIAGLFVGATFVYRKRQLV